jgi:glycosyltransferase involved in cell wall biosynthesis
VTFSTSIKRGKMKLSIIIPVYNEEDNINKVILKVLKVSLHDLKVSKEIIIVDDDSSDGSWKVIEEISKNRKDISFMRHKQNIGKGGAVKTGLIKATGDLFIIQDADMEYEPNEYPKLIKPIIKGDWKVVYGTRFGGKQKFGDFKHPGHYFGNKLLTSITNILFGSKITDMETCYKVFTREVYEKIKPIESNKFDFEPEITSKILKNGIKIKEVPISYNSREFSEGKKITWVDGIKALFVLIKYRFLR